MKKFDVQMLRDHVEALNNGVDHLLRGTRGRDPELLEQVDQHMERFRTSLRAMLEGVQDDPQMTSEQIRIAVAPHLKTQERIFLTVVKLLQPASGASSGADMRAVTIAGHDGDPRIAGLG